MTTVGDCLAAARATLPRLEADVLTARALEQRKSALYAFPERQVTPRLVERHAAWVERRRRGEPVAYIIGEREFWSLTLNVDARVLIPRPETECLVEAALRRVVAGARVLDLGTGSGAVALAIAKARPSARVLGIDRDRKCVHLAGRNAERLGIAAVFEESDWFAAIDGCFDVIVANPPYVAQNDPHLHAGDVRFEPITALTAGPDGLSELRRIVCAAPAHLHAAGWLLVEHGFDQGTSVRELFAAARFGCIETLPDAAAIPRVTLGQRS